MATSSPAFHCGVLCGLLCVLYAILSGTAVSQKSATYDEPLHVATGWLNLYRGDYRLSPDVPPLWEYWIALPLGRDALNFDATPTDVPMDYRAVAALYGVPPADGVHLVNLARAMSLPLAILLGILIAVCAGQIAGPVAAVAAMVAFAFDPNWLGHGPLAKNDVPFALAYFATGYAIWRLGKRPSLPLIGAVLILPAIALGVKYSALMIGPVMVVCLIARAMMSDPWMKCRGRPAKLGVAIAICTGALLIAWAGIWAQYRFRFDAGLDMNQMLGNLRDAQVRSEFQINQPTPAQYATWHPDLVTSFVLALDRHHLVPQAWAGGFLYIQTQAGERLAYLLGQVYPGGRWSYFPLAWLFKEPLAMIAAALVAAVIGLARLRKIDWSGLAMLIPAAFFLAAAMCGNVNIGLRHIFAVIPFIDVGIGAAAAFVWRHGRLARMAALLLAAGCMLESVCSYPDYIAFFNLACGGERGGISLLGDSNLDWGQDLPLLAAWQTQHPNVPLYLDYFGVCDPAAYGIRYLNVPGGYVYGPPPRPPISPGVAAISATKLQRLFVIDRDRDFATPFERERPIGVLGGTIYLFDYPPR
ncbi:MAG TPA: hypothetical protein VL992_03665 [Tepidisphaeraceae bacterium]|nr:hypothetical protein [Tepidisphaeraceae bacterium]